MAWGRRRLAVTILLGVMALTAACQDPPETQTEQNPPRLVFAHYYPPLPISLDNADPAADYYQRHYLTTHGENGKHSSYGGYLRDRPLPRPVRHGDWRMQDLQAEVRQAISGGLDGFTLDIIQFPGDEDPQQQVTTARTLMTAAQAVDPNFKIMLMLDMSGGAKSKPAAEVAAFTAELAQSPSAYRLDDGRLVLSAFLAEGRSPSWWKGLLGLMRTQYGFSVAFVPTFLDEPAHREAFAPISYGMGNWGNRNPADNDPRSTVSSSRVGRVRAAHDLGKRWLQPVSIQDERPREGVFEEAENTRNLRDTWEVARRSGTDWVQIPTWNDYAEGTHLAPSVKHGYGFLDLNSYYVSWYKTGRRPRVVRDTVYLTHRLQPWQALPTYRQSLLMTLRGSTPARDTIEALTFLKAPGEVTITAGSARHTCSVPAGEATCVVPLSTGRVSATVTRDGATVASVTSSHQVTDTPNVQDLQYVIASSSRPGPHVE